MKKTKLNSNLSSLISHLSSRKGFTLIELLIVIIIIGALATILFANYLGIRERARDSKRKSDLRQIQAALELIRSNTDSYPASLYSANCPASSPLQAGTPAVTYMKKIPCDPKPPSAGSFTNGNYYYNLSGGSTYSIGACIENVNDTDPNVFQTVAIVCPLLKLYLLTSQ